MVGCDSEHRHLLQLQSLAEQQQTQILHYLQAGQPDSLRDMTLQEQHINYYIYYQDRLVYWSDNRLAGPAPTYRKYNEWAETSFANADCQCRWVQQGAYDVLAAIPVQWHMEDNEYVRNSFSYRPLLASGSSWWQGSRWRVRLMVIVLIVLYSAFLGLGIYGLVRHRGFSNMRLSTKFQYLIVSLVLISFGFVFGLSIRYMRTSYQERQRTELEQKSRYIQSALQNLYFWDIDLSPRNTPSLNADLRDLAFAYGTDIHVFDMRGMLIGSSTPELFEHNLLSPHMAPELFFTGNTSVTLYETIGDMRYLAAYQEFVNGNFMPIGYISVPSFISEDEMMMQVDKFLRWLIPVYVIILLLAIIISSLVSRGLTAKLSKLGDRMRNLRLDHTASHITYTAHDEVGELVTRYNQMVDQLEKSSILLAKSEREGAWRTMARQIAHEINNPLTPMKLSIQRLQRLKGTDRFDRVFDEVSCMLVEQIDTLSLIASSFSAFAKMPEVKVDVVDIAAKLSQAVALCRNNPEGIPVRYVGADYGVLAYADPDQVSQVFVNIIRNAVQAIRDDARRTEGSLSVPGDIIVIMKDLGAEIEVSVSDNGPGIPEDIRSKIFVPNFTTKSTGTGLGLAISRNIVEGSGGRICFETSEKGTIFFVHFKKKQ